MRQHGLAAEHRLHKDDGIVTLTRMCGEIPSSRAPRRRPNKLMWSGLVGAANELPTLNWSRQIFPARIAEISRYRAPEQVEVNTFNIRASAKVREDSVK